MPKYHVHVYPIVRVLVRDVEAESQVEAIKKAEERVDLSRFFTGLNIPTAGLTVQYADDLDGFLVDEDGDTEHERSTGYGQDYKPV